MPDDLRDHELSREKETTKWPSRYERRKEELLVCHCEATTHRFQPLVDYLSAPLTILQLGQTESDSKTSGSFRLDF
jgi:hypothetical protein